MNTTGCPVVLFGAGASYGAGAIAPARPPLGADLYAELARHYPQTWGSVPNDIRAAFNCNFEAGMAIIWKEHSTAIPLLMRHLTLFFAQFRSVGDDLYYHFIRGLALRDHHNNVLYSSLNYECLLEFAAIRNGLTVNYFSPDLSPGSFAKLHGSCNFLPVGIDLKRGASFRAGATLGHTLRAVDPVEAVGFCLSDTGLYPAMALYMDLKPVQIGAGVIASMQQAWATRILNAKRVLVIGARPSPNDRHIWDPLATAHGALGFVGSESEMASWRDAHRQDRTTVYLGPTWDTCLKETVGFLCTGGQPA